MATRQNKRALAVIRTLRSRQQKLSDKIDILCHDMVSAHTDFSVHLSNLNFVTAFYASLLSCGTLEQVLDTAIAGLRGGIEQADAAVILLSENGFDVHVCDPGVSDPVEQKQFRNWFTRELVSSVSQMNRVCTLQQLLRMGLQGPPAIMKTLSAAAVPLGRVGQGVGLVLLYRSAHLPLQTAELSRAAAVATGLRKAVMACLPQRTCPLPESELSL